MAWINPYSEEDELDEPVGSGAPDQVENFPVSVQTELPGDELNEE